VRAKPIGRGLDPKTRSRSAHRRRTKEGGSRQFDAFLRRAGIVIEPVTEEHLRLRPPDIVFETPLPPLISPII
jgi:hypothetical protein